MKYQILVGVMMVIIGWLGWGGKMVEAKEYEAFVSPVFPIRGDEFWPLKTETPASNFDGLYKMVAEKELPATWLFRYDALGDPQINTVARFFSKTQERGIFLEVTPSLAQAAGVIYPEGQFWSDAHRVFLSGYSLDDRKLLIDTAMSQFLKVYGHFPVSVGAWHIDAWSANYLNRSYSIKSVLIVADQYSTDRYQLWGGWWGVPYYPSKQNILVPAQTEDMKIPAVVIHWAARDPVNGYGEGVERSTHSVQVNDYLLHELGIDYFDKLLDIYLLPRENNAFGFVTIGIENDYDLSLYSGGLAEQLGAIKRRQIEGQVEVVTMSEFGNWYTTRFDDISPTHIIQANDPLGSGKVMRWEMSPEYRIGYEDRGDKVSVLDWRKYNQNYAEAYLENRNQLSSLYLYTPAEIDNISVAGQSYEMDKSGLDDLRQKKAQLPFQTNYAIVVAVGVSMLIILGWWLRREPLLARLIAIGSTVISLPMLKSGRLYPYGMGFWGPNGHDGVWHLALIEHFAKHWNWQSPIMAGETLSNYHFGFDMLMAVIHSVTKIPAHTLYFQIIPLAMAVGLGLAVYGLMWQWTRSRLAGYLAIILIYFGGSWGWVVNWYRSGSWEGESLFWANQAISTLINPPFALSVIVLLVGLRMLIDYVKNPNFKILILISFLFGLLIQIKAYAGVLGLGGLAVISFWELFQGFPPSLKLRRAGKVSKFQNRKEEIWSNLKVTKVFALSSLVAAVVFLPVNKGSGGLLTFSPLWFPHNMLSYTDRFNWPKLEEARQVYWTVGAWHKALAAEMLALAIFLAGNLGTRLVGFVWLLQKIKAIFKIPGKVEQIDLMLWCMCITALVLPLLFVQKGNPWNTIQFFYYGLILMSLFSAKVLSDWVKSWNLDIRSAKLVVGVLFGIVLLLNLPTTLGTLSQYLPYRAPSRIPYEELSALKFLRNQEEGVVLTYPFEYREVDKYEPPRALTRYVPTAYVSAFSTQPLFMEDEVNLEIIGAKWRERRDEAVRFFGTDNEEWAGEFVNRYQVKYLYLLRGQSMSLYPEQLGFRKIFDNGLVIVYKKI